MDTTRDLSCPDLWQQSLQRSLARRGKPTRSSLELFRLQPARDLTQSDLLRESLTYSQLRRSAAARRPAISLPSAGGLSALALLAATTVPGLLGGRAAHAATERVAFRTAAGGSRPAHPAVAAPTPAAAVAAPRPAAVRAPVIRATSTSIHSSSTASASLHSPPKDIALAHDATASRGASGGAVHALSGGAAPPATNASAAAPRVPGNPQPAGHPSTGGSAIAKAPTRAHVPKRLVTKTHATTTHPVARTHPAPKPAASAPPAPPAAAGGYTNPLAHASVTPERIDQGVDYAGSGTLGAVGAGTVTYIGLGGTGWPGAFIEYRLSGGSYAGRYVYYAEGVSPASGLQVGETLQADQPVAEIVPGSPTGIEIGWGAGVGTETLAMQLGQWKGGDDADSVPSASGKSFSALIASLGGPPGKVEG